MSFRRVPYSQSVSASWFMLWRSVVTGVAPGVVGSVCLLWLNGFLARAAVGNLRNLFSTKDKDWFFVWIPGFLMYCAFKETWDQARSGTVTYLNTVLTTISAALLISSITTNVLPADSGVEPTTTIFYFVLGPALGTLGGLTLFANGLLNKEFLSFRLIATKRVKDAEERILRLSQPERIRVAWFLFWRGFGMGALVDIGLVFCVVVLLYPFSDTATARTAAFYAGKAAASSGLLLSTLLVGFPLAIPQLVQKTFRAKGSTFAIKLVHLKPLNRETGEEQQSRDYAS
jgi:hypothetical protein